MHANIISKFSSFYFIGIGGVSMSGLAKYLIGIGKRVGGSDISPNEYIDELIEKGAQIDFTNDASDIDDYEVVIYTDAIGAADPRLIRAAELSKPLISRGRFLHEVSLNFKTVIAISGCHGKTTCSAMLAHVFCAADKKFSSHIGGKDLTFSNFYCNGHDYFISEACEYKKNFLLLKPDIAVILNSDMDHVECYGSEEAVKSAYIDFAGNAERTVYLYGDLDKVNGINFGFDRSADYSARNIKSHGGVCSFTLYEKSEKLGGIYLSVYGKHNVLNALAAAAVARSLGLPFGQIAEGLKNFSGVERRFEKLAEVNGVSYYADYAHHPNELRACLKTFRKLTQGDIYAVFQPHTYSRTKLLFKDFVKVLSPLPRLLIYKTFAAREYYDDAGSALTLSQNIKRARYGDCSDDIKEFISTAKEGDIVLFLGAGDIYYLAKQILSS